MPIFLKYNFIQSFTDSQLAVLESNEAVIDQREREINHIAKSIHQLAEIFRDLQTLVIDQGTMLDRIDYNIEQSAIQLKEATVQLDKVSRHIECCHECLYLLHTAGCTVSKQDTTSKTDTFAYLDHLSTYYDSYCQGHKVMIPPTFPRTPTRLPYPDF